MSEKSPPAPGGRPGGTRAVLGSGPARPLLLIAGLMLLAANLRPAITSVGPLLGDIRSSTGMSATAAGLLTTLPLLAFAGISPLAPGVGRRIGLERTLLAAIVLLAVGMLVRSAGPAAAVFAGTALVGTAIAVGNVLLPGLVKQDFPAKPGLMTGLYTTTMAGMAGVASGVSVLLAEDVGLGWRGALAIWTVLAAITVVLWSPYARGIRHVPHAERPVHVGVKLRGSLLAWQVTIFLGLQSLLFYSLVTWLPTLLEDEGASASTAGWLVAVMQIASLVATLGLPILADRRPSQRRLVIGSSVLSLAGLAGLWTLGAETPLLWVIPLGLGTGGVFALSLIFLVIRASDARHAAALSGMAQSLGYGLAAIGPIGLGALHDVTGSWDAAIIALGLVATGALVVGVAAAKDAHV